MDGTVQKDEVLNKSQIYVTSAGYKGSFAYDKLIQFLMWMITEPDKVIVLGGTYRIPVLFGLLEQDFLKDLEKDETYNEASFSREYDSRWSGSAEDAFFDSDMISKNRILLKAENEYSGHTATENGHYILGVDVGRKGCDTVIAVIKVIPQAFGPSFKSLVQLYTLTDVHFAQQSIFIKKVFYRFKCTRAVIDANGIGIGLVDELVTNQTDPDTGDTLPGFGVYNDDEGYYKQYKTDTTELDALYLIKANAPINTAAHAYLKASLQSGKLKMLIDEKKAKTRLLGTKVGQKMTPEQRAEYLKPYTLTSIFSEELLNLREDNEGANIILKQVNRKIGKDKVSAIEYALYYVKEEEETKKKRKHFNIADLMLFN